MEVAVIVLANIVMQTTAYIVMRPETWWRWTIGALLIGIAYQLPFWLKS